MDYISKFEKHKEKTLSGRYITLASIEPILHQFSDKGKLDVAGYSVNENPIYTYQIGSGKTKLLLWSQMHGNESTTTKAIFDVINVLHSLSDSEGLLSDFTFLFVPMLNPDGALLYTRENANKVDLNRDFLRLTQPESTVLMSLYESFNPDYCYNLHDQRTIFGVGTTGKPATASFLAPSFNEPCSINDVRLKAIKVLAGVIKELQKYIPGQIGRFDDAYNRNCAGDAFQTLGTPTMLFEAGHFPGDYEREESRKYMFIALLSSFYCLYENVLVNQEKDEYLNIPQNNPCFFDFVYRNVKINYENSELITNFATQFREKLVDSEIVFESYIESVGDLVGFYGHQEYNGEGVLFSDGVGNIPIIGKSADFNLGNSKFFVNSLLKK